MRNLIIGAFLGALVSTAPAFSRTHPKALDEVRQAEITFDAYTHEFGYTKGFYHFSTEDAVAFEPDPYPIHQQLFAALKAGEPKDAPSRLRWKPDLIVVSRSGRMAVDVGE